MHKLLLILPLFWLGACNDDKGDVYAAKSTDSATAGRDRTETPLPPGTTTTPPVTTMPLPADSSSTAMDQSNDKADIDHLAEIRQALMNDAHVSVGGKNVTVLTDKGQVTLKGVVSSDTERVRIEDLARNVPATRSVDNQIQVEPK